MSECGLASVGHVLRVMAIGRDRFVRIFGAKKLVEQMLRPHYAMNGLARRISNRTARKRLGGCFGQTVIAFGVSAAYEHHLAQITFCFSVLIRAQFLSFLMHLVDGSFRPVT